MREPTSNNIPAPLFYHGGAVKVKGALAYYAEKSMGEPFAVPSKEYQAMHGYSLEAQREALTKYAKEHSLFIFDYYVDEGKSARKRYNKRKEFMRMMEDVQANKIDLILFIKLDRWFRSVKDYYKIQEILEAHNVNWKTTEDHYDTSTTDGRLYINIRLSVAQDESDRDSDRIKFVFDSKVARREVITGSVPMGFKIENKHLIHDPATVEMVRDLFKYHKLHNNKNGAIRYIFETYGIAMAAHTLSKMLTNPLYKGEYRGITGYCEPIIEPAVFDKIQQIAKSSNVRTTPAKRFYIFSSLVVCAECGYKMAGRYRTSGPKEYYHYRCNRSANIGDCSHQKNINEKDIEKWLLENIEDEISKYIVDYKAQLAETPEPTAPAVDFQALQDFLHSDFKAIYIGLDRKKRRTLWRSIIKQIRVDAHNHITVSLGCALLSRIPAFMFPG